MPVEKGVRVAVGRGLIPSPNGLREVRPLSLARRTGGAAAVPAPYVQQPARRPVVGYPSPVCSSQGEAVDRIVAAIDQLAADARGRTDPRELTARVAGVWEMICDLDPELARRAQAYTTNEGGAPSE
jgi:hypothetical protein